MAAPAQAQGRADAKRLDARRGASVTNVQTQGVDEGDIVKQLGRFLVVLQDGRLFVVDTAPGGQPGLALDDRAPTSIAMRATRCGTTKCWSAETASSSPAIRIARAPRKSPCSRSNDAGQLHREAIYYLSSNDYYSAENYATRLVNGNLVIYTPLNIAYLNPDQPMRWPLIRRWVRDGERQAETTRGKPLFDAQDIYRPIRPTLAPFVHSVSVCPLGDLRSGDELDCRTTAFVGTVRARVLRLHQRHLSLGDARLGRSPMRQQRSQRAVSATLYQVPLSGRSPRALFTRGAPINQFALDANGGEFRALLGMGLGGCGGGDEHPRCATSTRRSLRSAQRPHKRPGWSYVNEPSPDGARYEPRFTETYLVYGSRPSWSSYPPQGDRTVTGPHRGGPGRRARTTPIT